MRNALDTIDPLPAFPSDGIAFELQDTEPAYEPSERHKRLPSYREAKRPKVEPKAIAAFNGNCDPHITEVACRKSMEPPIVQLARAQGTLLSYDAGSKTLFLRGMVSIPEGWPHVNETTGFNFDVAGLTPAFDEHPKQAPAEQPKADADGWVVHEGQERPIAAGLRLVVRHRNGNEEECDSEHFCACWEIVPDAPHPLDIVAYRVIA